MPRHGIAMDIGTSGLRAQAVDLDTGAVVSTAITTRHPLPGANVIDHVHFALEMGVDAANKILVQAANTVMEHLRVPLDGVVRLAVCGNPIQLSLFEGIEIRDLAYAGKRKLEALGVGAVDRSARMVAAREIPRLALPPGCEVIIPPAVRHEIGADALAMMIQTRMLEKEETAITTDYGTNAEMALFHQGRVYTGSTAAGPALEGQMITCGMLAVPGAVSDLVEDAPNHRAIVLDGEMLPAQGPLLQLKEGRIIDPGAQAPLGITGTGTVAVMSQGMEAGLIKIPHINTPDGEFHLGEGIFFTEKDLMEAGKAVGSVRAGHITLCQEAGIPMDAIRTAYMSGASGTYVDALKARKLGMIPAGVEKIHQVGNTSLAQARDLVRDPKTLDEMARLAETLRQTHCMFAASKVFEKVYILEISHWTEGMPMAQYRKFLKKYGIPDLPAMEGEPEIHRTVLRDIEDLGAMGLTTIKRIGITARVAVAGCTACETCVGECPEDALLLEEAGEPVLLLDQALCNGVACRRCERACPEKVLELDRFFS